MTKHWVKRKFRYGHVHLEADLKPDLRWSKVGKKRQYNDNICMLLGHVSRGLTGVANWQCPDRVSITTGKDHEIMRPREFTVRYTDGRIIWGQRSITKVCGERGGRKKCDIYNRQHGASTSGIGAAADDWLSRQQGHKTLATQSTGICTPMSELNIVTKFTFYGWLVCTWALVASFQVIIS